MGNTGEIFESVLQEIEESLEAGMGKALEKLDQERAGMVGDRRLTGWKEIANFLGISVSTSQRYHKAGVIPIWQPVSGGIPFTTENSIVSVMREKRIQRMPGVTGTITQYFERIFFYECARGWPLDILSQRINADRNIESGG